MQGPHQNGDRNGMLAEHLSNEGSTSIDEVPCLPCSDRKGVSRWDGGGQRNDTLE